MPHRASVDKRAFVSRCYTLGLMPKRERSVTRVGRAHGVAPSSVCSWSHALRDFCERERIEVSPTLSRRRSRSAASDERVRAQRVAENVSRAKCTPRVAQHVRECIVANPEIYLDEVRTDVQRLNAAHADEALADAIAAACVVRVLQLAGVDEARVESARARTADAVAEAATRAAERPTPSLASLSRLIAHKFGMTRRKVNARAVEGVSDVNYAKRVGFARRACLSSTRRRCGASSRRVASSQWWRTATMRWATCTTRGWAPVSSRRACSARHCARATIRGCSSFSTRAA